MIEETAKFLSAFPGVSKCGVKVNYLNETSLGCSLKLLSTVPVAKKYVDGGVVGEAKFLLTLRQDYAQVNSVNKAAARICEEFEEWIEVQNECGNLPQLENGKVPLDLILEKTFEITSTGGNDARFEAELKLNFLKPQIT